MNYKLTADVITKEIKIWNGNEVVHKAIGYKDAKKWIREQNENCKNRKKKGA